jgi:hypothetical protein
MNDIKDLMILSNVFVGHQGKHKFQHFDGMSYTRCERLVLTTTYVATPQNTSNKTTKVDMQPYVRMLVRVLTRGFAKHLPTYVAMCTYTFQSLQ